jgi:flagellar FliL protein
MVNGKDFPALSPASFAELLPILNQRAAPKAGTKSASDSVMLGKKKKKKDEAEAPDADAPAPDAANENAEGAEGEAGGKKKMSGKKLVIFFILPAVLVLGGGGAAAYLLLFKGGQPEQHADAGHAKAKGADHSGESTPGPNGTTITQGEGVVFVTMPEMLVNIGGPDGRAAFLKLKLTIEAPNDEVVSSLTTQLPRVSDEFNGFLRELRTDDLAGSAGAYRLRLELLRRVNLAIAPQQANAVLIEEMMVQ